MRIPFSAPKGQCRGPGGGRKKLEQKDSSLLADLDRLVEPSSRGHPESILRWTAKSTATLAGELRANGHEVNERTVASLLKKLDYSLQSMRKTKEGGNHPDRNAQFEYISKLFLEFQADDQPTVSVDAKKKELVQTAMHLRSSLVTADKPFARCRQTARPGRRRKIAGRIDRPS